MTNFSKNRRKKSIQRQNPKSISAPYRSYQKPKGKYRKKKVAKNSKFFFEKLSIEPFQRTLTRSHTIKTHCCSMKSPKNTKIGRSSEKKMHPLRVSRMLKNACDAIVGLMMPKNNNVDFVAIFFP